MPGVNPSGTKADGPFEAFVGADGIAIWAAATSGPAAIGIHLLACMLARQFEDPKEGIALWVEMVIERKQEIQTLINENHVVSASSAIAARQDISREELAIFDASVRSWLCSADEAKLSNQKQLMLILNNLSVPLSSGSSTYHTLINAWVLAIQGFESLLGGISQEVSNGAILRALSSWHLYPNLIILTEKIVNLDFQDSLVPEGSVITVGVQSSSPKQKEGIHWSLTLSHLRYYGNPVPLKSNGSGTLVNILQLHLVAFGSLLGTWHILQKDIVVTASWFRTLWNLLRSLPSEPDTPPLDLTLPWLNTLTTAANTLLNSQGGDRETAMSLINYGRRELRQSFLSEPSEHTKTFFGLGNQTLLNALKADNELECGIRYFRDLAARSELCSQEALISFRRRYEPGEIFDDYGLTDFTMNDPLREFVEFATAVSYSTRSSKHLLDRSMKSEQVSTHSHYFLSLILNLCDTSTRRTSIYVFLMLFRLF